MCMAGTSRTTRANHLGRSCRLLPGCRVPGSIRELLFRLRLNKIGWPFRLREKLSALFRSEQVSRNRSVAPTVYDSFQPRKDGAPRACPVVRLVFQNEFLFAYSQASPQSLNELMFFLADDEDATWRGAYDSLSGAADAQMPPAGISVGRDRDKIDVHLLGRFGYLIGCMPNAHR